MISEADVEGNLYQAIVDHAKELITVFDATGTIIFVSEACRLFGYPPGELIGKRIVDFVHPDEQVRAEVTLGLIGRLGTSSGTTHFRMRLADGSFAPLEMTAGNFLHDGQPRMMTICRLAETRFVLDVVLRRLLEDRPLRDVCAAVCNLFGWRALGSSVAVAWQGGDGEWDWAATPGFPAGLSGVPLTDGSIWARAIADGKELLAADLSILPDELRAIASDAQRAGCWIMPIVGTGRPAMISVWTAPTADPRLHAEAMEMASRLLRLIARWSHQHTQLERAASFDELTGLSNRQAFFSALSAAAHGAVLYCDLDRFKPVNDAHGHAAGDEVLRVVARRLRATVRATDVVARIGGDEFAIICPSSTAADAVSLADRIRAAVEQPIPIGEQAVQVGISIGIAHTTDRLDAASVAEADRALYAAKAARGPRERES